MSLHMVKMNVLVNGVNKIAKIAFEKYIFCTGTYRYILAF
jgi:hypothetical protein